MQRATIAVNVFAIGHCINRVHFCAQLGEHFRRDRIRRAVGAVKRDANAFQIQLPLRRAFAVFNIATFPVADAIRLAQLVRINNFKRLV